MIPVKPVIEADLLIVGGGIAGLATGARCTQKGMSVVVVEKYKGLMLVSSGIEFDKYETAKTAILGELEACRRGEISEAELESARRGILSALRAALDVPARLDDYYIGNAIAGGDSVEALIEKITRLSKDDLVRAAQRIRTDTVFFLEGVEA